MIAGHDTHSGAVYRVTSSARTTTATPATATATATPATATPATATATPAAAMATATTATTATTAPAMTTTAAQIRTAMEALDLDQVAAHFAARADDDMDDDENNDNDDDLDDDVGPLVVCDGVSVRAFNEYVGDGEGLRIGVRFLQLEADGRLLIVEFPLRVHEATADHFKFAFVQAFGNVDEIGTGGSFTARRAGLPRKEADATFGPTRSTPNRTLVPPNLTFEDWITLAVEIGRSQSWASLLVAARWWHGYPGIQYILLLKIGRQARRLRYAFYDALHPLVPGQGLPAPVAEGTIYRRTVGLQTPENIQFDARRILSIPVVPQGFPLPPNVNDPIAVDLCDVMTRVMNNI